MKERLFFCVDLGTSSLKAALIDNTGSLHAFVRIPFRNDGKAVPYLNAFYSAADQLAGAWDAAGRTLPVAALIISGSGPTLIPVKGKDPESSESMRPIYWNDPLTPLKNMPLEKTISLFLPRLKAFIDADLSNIAGVRYFFSPQEWLSWKLGAGPVTVIPHEAYIPFYWDDIQCSRLEIDQNWFPPFVNMGSIIGELNSAVFLQDGLAAKLLPAGIPLIAGAADFIMALIGTGTLEPGKACDRTGSSEGINLCVSNLPAAGSALRILPHAIPGLWNIGAHIPKSGILFEQYRSETAQARKPHADLVREIFSDSSHSGWAVLEKICDSFIKAIDNLEAAGQVIKELTLSGGQCAEGLWNQYKADRSRKVLLLPKIIHAELTGNAILGVSVLSSRNITETAAQMIHIQKRYFPV